MSAITTRKTKTSVAITDADVILIDDEGHRININEDGSLNVKTSPTLINLRRYNATLNAVKDVVNNHINYIVPIGKTCLLLRGVGTSNSWAIWQIKIDGVLYKTVRNTYAKPDVELDLETPILLTAGQNLTIDVTNKSITDSLSEIETWFYGSEQ